MKSNRQAFYGRTSLRSVSRGAVLEGKVIKINPALITIIDGRNGSHEPSELQTLVYLQVQELLVSSVFTFHVDINYPDYGGYPQERPINNTDIFSPAFVGRLNEIVRAKGKYLNLHLLTNAPLERFQEYKALKIGAVCFQLEVIQNLQQLKQLIDCIIEHGASPSPVIETVGSENLQPLPIQSVEKMLKPVISRVDMLTFQAAGTASRSTENVGAFHNQQLREYVKSMRRIFSGTLQFQGGIRMDMIRDAVRLGGEFLVAGTEIFRNREGLGPADVINLMLSEAAIEMSSENKTFRDSI